MGGVTCLPAAPSLSATGNLWVACFEGPGRCGEDLTSCLLAAGVVGGVTCRVAGPPLGCTLRRSLNGRPTVMPWSMHPVVEYKKVVVPSLGNLVPCLGEPAGLAVETWAVASDVALVIELGLA